MAGEVPVRSAPWSVAGAISHDLRTAGPRMPTSGEGVRHGDSLPNGTRSPIGCADVGRRAVRPGPARSGRDGLGVSCRGCGGVRARCRPRALAPAGRRSRSALRNELAATTSVHPGQHHRSSAHSSPGLQASWGEFRSRNRSAVVALDLAVAGAVHPVFAEACDILLGPSDPVPERNTRYPSSCRSGMDWNLWGQQKVSIGAPAVPHRMATKSLAHGMGTFYKDCEHPHIERTTARSSASSGKSPPATLHTFAASPVTAADQGRRRSDGRDGNSKIFPSIAASSITA